MRLHQVVLALVACLLALSSSATPAPTSKPTNLPTVDESSAFEEPCDGLSIYYLDQIYYDTQADSEFTPTGATYNGRRVWQNDDDVYVYYTTRFVDHGQWVISNGTYILMTNKTSYHSSAPTPTGGEGSVLFDHFPENNIYWPADRLVTLYLSCSSTAFPASSPSPMPTQATASPVQSGQYVPGEPSPAPTTSPTTTCSPLIVTYTNIDCGDPLNDLPTGYLVMQSESYNGKYWYKGLYNDDMDTQKDRLFYSARHKSWTYIDDSAQTVLSRPVLDSDVRPDPPQNKIWAVHQNDDLLYEPCGTNLTFECSSIAVPTPDPTPSPTTLAPTPATEGPTARPTNFPTATPTWTSPPSPAPSVHPTAVPTEYRCNSTWVDGAGDQNGQYYLDYSMQLEGKSVWKKQVDEDITIFYNSGDLEGTHFLAHGWVIYDHSNDVFWVSQTVPTNHPPETSVWDQYYGGNLLLQDTATLTLTCDRTSRPTVAPSVAPTESPTDVPSNSPTIVPTNAPWESPTAVPSDQPSDVPTNAPTVVPSDAPTNSPTQQPTAEPTNVPSNAPTVVPTDVPTNAPSSPPTNSPTRSDCDFLLIKAGLTTDDGADYAGAAVLIANSNVSSPTEEWEYDCPYDTSKICSISYESPGVWQIDSDDRSPIYVVYDNWRPPADSSTWGDSSATRSAQLTTECVAETTEPTDAPTIAPTPSPTSPCLSIHVSYNVSDLQSDFEFSGHYYRQSYEINDHYWYLGPRDNQLRYVHDHWYIFDSSDLDEPIVGYLDDLDDTEFPISGDWHYVDQYADKDLPALSLTIGCYEVPQPSPEPTTEPTFPPTENDAPVWSNCNDYFVYIVDSSDPNATVYWDEPTISDTGETADSLTLTYPTYSPGDQMADDTYTLTYVATDSGGLSTTCTMTLYVFSLSTSAYELCVENNFAVTLHINTDDDSFDEVDDEDVTYKNSTEVFARIYDPDLADNGFNCYCYLTLLNDVENQESESSFTFLGADTTTDIIDILAIILVLIVLCLCVERTRWYFLRIRDRGLSRQETNILAGMDADEDDAAAIMAGVTTQKKLQSAKTKSTTHVVSPRMTGASGDVEMQGMNDAYTAQRETNIEMEAEPETASKDSSTVPLQPPPPGLSLPEVQPGSLEDNNLMPQPPDSPSGGSELYDDVQATAGN